TRTWFGSSGAARRESPHELDDGFESLRRRLALAGRGHEGANAAIELGRPGAEPRPTAQVDRLRRDDELDCEHARAQVDHVAEPARRERRQRDAVLDSLVV